MKTAKAEPTQEELDNEFVNNYFSTVATLLNQKTGQPKNRENFLIREEMRHRLVQIRRQRGSLPA